MKADEGRAELQHEGYDMKFKTADLLAAVEAEIKRRTTVAEHAFAKAQEDYAKGKAEWLASNHPTALSVAAKRIVEKVRKGRVVTITDLADFDTQSYRGPRHAFTWNEPKRDSTKGATPQLDKLESLRDFLKAVSDDEVTSTGLREVGFRNIAEILRAAATR